MNKRIFLAGGGVAALSLALMALPGLSEQPQYRVVAPQEPGPVLAPDGIPNVDLQDLNVVVGEEGPSWLGVEVQEVSGEKAKELKLPAERGALLEKILPDSPAAKAGLKENDVVTEINGQRIEGAAQFRRVIHEIPAGRTAQITVWREGRSQTLSVTLGKAEQGNRVFRTPGSRPGTFVFRMPEMPVIPDIPPMEWDGAMILGGSPRLGIDAEDLTGQLGAFFGAPNGEGVLVREVNSGSPAEKGGVQAGDVITSLDGERISSIGELREKLSTKHGDKERTVKLGVLRNHNAISLTVALPASPARTKHTVMRQRTNI